MMTNVTSTDMKTHSSGAIRAQGARWLAGTILLMALAAKLAFGAPGFTSGVGGDGASGFFGASGVSGGLWMLLEGYVWPVIELVVGLWLVGGLWPAVAHVAALGVFGLLTVVSGVLMFRASESCGCLGEVPVKPHWMFLLDVCIVTLLLVTLRSRRKTLPPLPRSIGIAAALSMAVMAGYVAPRLVTAELAPAPGGAPQVIQTSPPAQETVSELELIGIAPGDEARIGKGAWLLILPDGDMPKAVRQQVDELRLVRRVGSPWHVAVATSGKAAAVEAWQADLVVAANSPAKDKSTWAALVVDGQVMGTLRSGVAVATEPAADAASTTPLVPEGDSEELPGAELPGGTPELPGAGVDSVTKAYATVGGRRLVAWNGGWPRMTVDLGYIVPGSTTSWKVQIVNPSEATIEVTKHSVECRCTQLKTVPGVLKPGEPVWMDMDFAAPNEVGEYRKRITFRTSDKDIENIELTITARLAQPLSAPTQVVKLAADDARATVVIRNDTKESVGLIYATSTSAAVNAKLVDSKVAGHGEGRLTLDVKGEQGADPIEADIRVQTTEPNQPTVNLRVVVREGQLLVNPIEELKSQPCRGCGGTVSHTAPSGAEES